MAAATSSATTLGTAPFVLVPELRALDAHARPRLAKAQLRVVKHRDREVDRLLLEVHDERIPGEAPVVTRVQLHLRVPRVVLFDQPELPEARDELIRICVGRQACDIYGRVLGLALGVRGGGGDERAVVVTIGGGGGRTLLAALAGGASRPV